MNKMRNITVFFSFSLLFLFASCALMLVYAQVQGYQDLTQDIDQDFETYTPMAYLTNKIHSYDQNGSISLQTIEGVSCLCLQDDKTQTWIYVQEGALKELYTLKGVQADLQAGETLMECEHLSMQLQGQTLFLEVNAEKMQLQLHCEVGV